MYWFQERCYKTLENAINAYEEYKKNERILNGEGLAPLPLSFVEGAEMFSLTNNISAHSFEKTNIELAPGKVHDLPKSYNCRNCGAPVRSCTCEYCGTRY